MKTGPDFELLKDAYAIIDGIPETAIDLDRLQTAKGEALDKGTICSPAGWLAQHPKFMELGLSLSEDGKQLCLNGQPAQPGTESEILAQIFGLSPAEAQHLFGTRDTYSLGDDSGLSDKRLWLREVREFLKQHHEIDEHFEDLPEAKGPFAEPANPAEIRAI